MDCSVHAKTDLSRAALEFKDFIISIGISEHMIHTHKEQDTCWICCSWWGKEVMIWGRWTLCIFLCHGQIISFWNFNWESEPVRMVHSWRLESDDFQEGLGEYTTDLIGKSVDVQVNRWYTKVGSVDTIAFKRPYHSRTLRSPPPSSWRGFGLWS